MSLLDSIPTFILYIIFALIIIIPVGVMLFLRYFQKKDSVSDIKSMICMIVSIPKESAKTAASQNKGHEDFKDLISPMEQFFSTLTTIIHQKHFVDWLFSTPDHVSFEITSVGGTIQFSVFVLKELNLSWSDSCTVIFRRRKSSTVFHPRYFPSLTPVSLA